MTRLIKKYKNRRLYDTERSQYITIDELQRYVLDGISFSVVEVHTGKEMTNATLLQIVMDLESGSSQFLSTEVLRQFIVLAHHPMSQIFKVGFEQMMATIDKQIKVFS